MTPGALLTVIVVLWAALFAGLWRLSASMDQIERVTSRLAATVTPARGPRRG